MHLNSGRGVLAAVLGFVGACAGEPTRFPGSERISAAGQHVLVVVESEGDSAGQLYRFERDGDGWHAAGGPIPTMVGAAGVGKVREGDRRAPTGAYPLTTVFGYAESAPAGVRMPYLALRPETECVDDAGSSYYNRIVNPSEIPGGKSWTSSEMMRRDLHNGDDLYKLGVEVGYNQPARMDPESGKGAGSCIFLHIWRGPARPTVGCTAFPEASMVELLAWLDPARSPILVQGSRTELEQLHRAGVLPYEVPRRTVSL